MRTTVMGVALDRPLRWMLTMMSCLGLSNTCLADSGFLGIDHRLAKSDTGIWSRPNQRLLEIGAAAFVVGEALWEGSDTRFGKTTWQALDAMTLSMVASTAAKDVFRRQRPATGNDPSAWFKTSQDKSFFSGEVAHISAIVTPYILEYGKESPMVWALAALPVYDGVARMKSQAHWQSDVLVGAAMGAAIGYYSHDRAIPLSVTLLPRAVTIGYSKKF